MRPELRWIPIAVCLALAAPAAAAPISTGATLELQVMVPGRPIVSISGAGQVDVTGSTLTVPAGLVALSDSIIVPVTASTALQSVSITKLSNLSGSFSIGGVTAQAPGEVCSGGPALGEACNAGGGIGGGMGLTGTIRLDIIPDQYPDIRLQDIRVGQGARPPRTRSRSTRRLGAREPGGSEGRQAPRASGVEARRSIW